MSRRWVTVVTAGSGLVALVLTGAAVWRPADRVPDGQRRAVSTATVNRETLIEVTTAPGTLAYGPEQLVESRISGTVTGLPAVGAVVDRGKALFRVDDKPVVLMFGTLPAYRELHAGHPAPPGPTAPTSSGGAPGAASGPVPGTKGADVRQFEANLNALGYTGFTVDEQYTEQTAAAVRRWQKDQGLPGTGAVELGRVFYAPGAVRVAKLKLTPGAVTDGPVLAFTGTARLVTATIKEYERQLAKPATKVTVALPSGKEIPGTVTAVNTPPDDQPTAEQEPTLQVVIAVDDQSQVDGLDDGPAQVRFVAEERKDVLVVPVGALLALAEGGYGVEAVEGSSTRVIAVTTGLFANGKVEVSGPELREGMTVGMAR